MGRPALVARNLRRRVLRALIPVAVVAAALTATAQAGAAARIPSRGPIDPSFLAYRAALRAEGAGLPDTASPQSGGLVPAPVDARYWGKRALPLGPLALPASFDLRDTGKLTPVRNQGVLQNCWAFAALGSLESSLLPGAAYNLSEDNVAYGAGRDFDYGVYGGGNSFMAAAFLARWGGPVLESDDPYNTPSLPSPTPPLVDHVEAAR